MKSFVFCWLVSCSCVIAQDGINPNVLQKVKDRTVVVSVKHQLSEGDLPQNQNRGGAEYEISGTGFLIANNGYVVTSLSNTVPRYHVRFQIDGFKILKYHEPEIRVTLYSGTDRSKTHPAKLIYKDWDLGISVLKLNGVFRNHFHVQGDVAIQNMQKLWAVGFPLGKEGGATAKGPTGAVLEGTVTNVYRDNLENLEIIETDIRAGTGLHGAPLVNVNGELVGILAFQYFMKSRLNHCMPAGKLLGLMNGTVRSLTLTPTHFDVTKGARLKVEAKVVSVLGPPREVRATIVGKALGRSQSVQLRPAGRNRLVYETTMYVPPFRATNPITFVSNQLPSRYPVIFWTHDVGVNGPYQGYFSKHNLDVVDKGRFNSVPVQLIQRMELNTECDAKIQLTTGEVIEGKCKGVFTVQNDKGQTSVILQGKMKEMRFPGAFGPGVADGIAIEIAGKRRDGKAMAPFRYWSRKPNHMDFELQDDIYRFEHDGTAAWQRWQGMAACFSSPDNPIGFLVTPKSFKGDFEIHIRARMANNDHNDLRIAFGSFQTPFKIIEFAIPYQDTVCLSRLIDGFKLKVDQQNPGALGLEAEPNKVKEWTQNKTAGAKLDLRTRSYKIVKKGNTWTVFHENENVLSLTSDAIPEGKIGIKGLGAAFDEFNVIVN